MSKLDIQKYISLLQGRQSERTQITADAVLNELKKIALADTDITGKEKIKALELLGKHLGMFGDKVETDVDTELNININYGDENESGNTS